jgi:sec-independent protein translocase protein TatA
MRLGFQELLVVLAIVLVIFGSTRLPALGKGLGEGIRNFKKGIKGGDDALAGKGEHKNGAD